MIALPHTSYVLLGNSLNLSVPWFPTCKIRITTLHYPTLYTSYVLTVYVLWRKTLCIHIVPGTMVLG